MISRRLIILWLQALSSRRFQRGFDRVNLHGLTACPPLVPNAFSAAAFPASSFAALASFAMPDKSMPPARPDRFLSWSQTASCVSLTLPGALPPAATNSCSGVSEASHAAAASSEGQSEQALELRLDVLARLTCRVNAHMHAWRKRSRRRMSREKRKD
jgi:hypothetical protein